MNGRQIADLLRQARDLMNDQGKHWIQGQSATLRGFDDGQPQYERFCSIGAIRYVLTGDPFNDGNADENYLVQCLDAQITLPGARGDYQGSDKVVLWNDMTGREWGEVYEAFTNAALSAEASS